MIDNNPNTLFFFLLLVFLNLISISNSTLQTPPPLPILPIPSASQLQWQLSPLALFIHFGPNTFTNSEWGSGKVDPRVFNPTHLNASQWVDVAQQSGFDRLLLTAKHHDGFCLWPSDYTDYSVRSSGWRNATGDVVADLALAARHAGLGLGLYLSPWDRHDPSYGQTLDYNQYYLAQMTELLTRYGDIVEIFLDGAKGEGEKDMEYFFDTWFNFIHQHQPRAVIFSDAGPDCRWVGDESGSAGTTSWSLFNRSNAKIAHTETQYSIMGDPQGQDWVPPECDVSIRHGWFWHASEAPKSALQLLDIYYKSVGRNCRLLLNVPPNSSGLISAEDIQVLKEFSELRASIFSNNLARSALVTASSTRGGNSDHRFSSLNVLEEGIYTYWAPEENQSDWVLYLNFQESVSFNVLQVQEPIQMGQRIVAFHLDTSNEEGEWKKVVNGTTVGYQRLLLFPTVKSKQLRFVVDESRADPLISYLGILIDRFSAVSMYNPISNTHMNNTHILVSNSHSQIASV